MDKVYIIEEIKRTAKENGGVPLGKMRFLSATGIKEADWLGKFWVCWTDAVVEAGFAPNAMQNAYDENALLDKYVSLVRELHARPTSVQLKFKARHDPDFPWHNTFSKLGSKAQLVSRIAEHCRSNQDDAEVLSFCETYLSGLKAEKTSPEKSEVEEFGFVYMLKSGRFYKIGKTNAIGRRERELAIQLPERANTVHTIRTDDPAGIEAYWHRRFSDRRKNGEWFELTSADVTAFKRRKFM